ncbi:thioredoxin [Halobacteriales archaeon QS_4_69_225]|nr:MAG: thioredoxin [Halobacteriales archaeon QS_4_69_225]
MELETMRPNPVWNAESYDDAVATFEAAADEVVVKVWGGDWCKDCRSQLPDLAAALEAAGVDAVEHRPVETADDGSKVGPGVEAYGIELIPTVVVEDDEGRELARFVESEELPVVVHLAAELEASDP